jgi:hypothetical protein
MGLVHWENGQIYYYPYTPSEVAGWLFMALFAAVTLAHVGHMFWVKTWYFIPLILGGICTLSMLSLLFDDLIFI